MAVTSPTINMHARLEIKRRGGGKWQAILRPGQTFLMGRGKDVTIKLIDPKASRHHASLELKFDSVFVTDLGSSNGTRIDGKQVPANKAVKVPTGSTIEVGSHRLVVTLVGFSPLNQARRNEQREEDAPLLPPEEYEILEQIGAGGMGRVWSAVQKLVGRKVAIKMLDRQMEVEPKQRERFLREGRLCMRVKSPYVVQVFDIRVAMGRPVLVMELVQGPSLRDLIWGAPLEIGEALALGHDVAQALIATSKVGVVHRDVKPHNIMLSPEGIAKLGDFGVAKDTTSKSLTTTGTGMGSISYAAPEQLFEAKSVDVKADIYGLGATLYCLLAGSPPFGYTPGGEALGPLETVKAVATDPPPSLRERRPDCPPEVAETIHRMLEKAPRNRLHPPEVVAERLSKLRERHYPDYQRRGWLGDTSENTRTIRRPQG